MFNGVLFLIIFADLDWFTFVDFSKAFDKVHVDSSKAFESAKTSAVFTVSDPYFKLQAQFIHWRQYFWKSNIWFFEVCELMSINKVEFFQFFI